MMSLWIGLMSTAWATEVCQDVLIETSQSECSRAEWKETCMYYLEIQPKTPVPADFSVQGRRGCGGATRSTTSCATTSPKKTLCYARFGECPESLPSALPKSCVVESDPEDPCPDEVVVTMTSGMGHTAFEYGCCVEATFEDRAMGLGSVAAGGRPTCDTVGTYINPHWAFYPGECEEDFLPPVDIPDPPTPPGPEDP